LSKVTCSTFHRVLVTASPTRIDTASNGHVPTEVHVVPSVEKDPVKVVPVPNEPSATSRDATIPR